MAKGFVKSDEAFFDGKGPLFDLDLTEALAVGTGLLFSQLLGVLFHERLKRSFDQAQRSSRGHLFHVPERKSGARGKFVCGATSDNLSPVVCEVPDEPKLIRRGVLVCHDVSCLDVAPFDENLFLF